jgi:hypothetical protein
VLKRAQGGGAKRPATGTLDTLQRSSNIEPLFRSYFAHGGGLMNTILYY